jgi:multidrug transporter EmrE-like cation transporter
MSLLQIGMLSLVEIVGDFGLKQYANYGGIFPLMAGIIGYMGVVCMLIISLQGSTILMVNGGWDGISTLIESAAAYIFLGERFHDIWQYIGLILIIIGMYLLKIPLRKQKSFVIPRLFR